MTVTHAAAKAPEGRRIVEIKGKTVAECGDARKLTIWNTGPGMSSTELDHVCDLAASLGKDMALESNFGMGAKVASLPSNTLGMRYRRVVLVLSVRSSSVNAKASMVRCGWTTQSFTLRQSNLCASGLRTTLRRLSNQRA
jgi:hypothetical protein